MRDQCGLAAVLLSSALLAFSAAAQPAKRQSVSPVAPPTLKAPVFDTTTPVPAVKPPQKAAEQVVAEVEGHHITLGEVADAINGLPPAERTRPYEELFHDTLTRLVRVQALLVQAQRQGLGDNAEVARRMRAAADAVLVAEYVKRANQDAVTEQALLDRYNKDFAGKPGPDEIHLSGIQVATEPEARAVIEELGGGADFAAVARRVSKDSTAGRGGDLGWVSRAQLAPEVAGVAFAMPAGKLVTTPIAGPSGWLVIKVDQRRQGPPPSFASVRGQLAETLSRENTPRLADQAVAQATVHEYGLDGQELNPATGDVLETNGAHFIDREERDR